MSSTPERLVMMANQIGTFFSSQGSAEAVAGTVTHIKKFWDPRMRAGIIEYLHAGGEGLRPEVRLAVEALAREAKSRPSAETPPGGSYGKRDVNQSSAKGGASGEAAPEAGTSAHEKGPLASIAGWFRR